MKLSAVLGMTIVSVATQATRAESAVEIGAPAPIFAAKDSNGKSVKLDDFKGKFVVMEWGNYECPYVKKHYSSNNMQNLQRRYTDKGVVWLTIFSSAEGKQGYYTPEVMNRKAAERKAVGTLIPDPDGKIGRLYGATNSPGMFVINPEGKIIYMGGIDDKPTADVADLASAKNYVALALDEALAGKPVSIPKSRPYGCSIKYKR